jgi:hypothetical protein
MGEYSTVDDTTVLENYGGVDSDDDDDGDVDDSSSDQSVTQTAGTRRAAALLAHALKLRFYHARLTCAEVSVAVVGAETAEGAR